MAEVAGREGFFVWDHLTWPGPVPVADPWVVLAAMVMQTERMLLGPMVTAPPRRRPWKLAGEIVTLDHLSEGRLFLGVGLGFWQMEEFEDFGEAGDPKIRAAKLDERLAVLTGLWSGKPFSYSGVQYEENDAGFPPPPVQQPRIPIWVGGAWPNKAPFCRAAQWDGVCPMSREDRPRLDPDAIGEIMAHVKAHRAREEPFEVVRQEQTPGKNSSEYGAIVSPYAEVGVMWWLESVRRRSSAELRMRIHQGPPRVA